MKIKLDCQRANIEIIPFSYVNSRVVQKTHWWNLCDHPSNAALNKSTLMLT